MKNVLTIPLCFIFIAVNAQLDYKKLVPPEPNVASIMKPVLTPVTEYAGIPNIGIPLYTIREDNVNFPISLSYHAGGIQISEESGNVGLGWACNAGGMITRAVNGRDDLSINEPSSTYLNTISTMPDYIPYSTGGYTFFNPLTNKFRRTDINCELPIGGVLTDFDDNTFLNTYENQDFLPDVFHFNFGGYSGSFILAPDANGDGAIDVFLFEKSGIDIKVDNPGNGLGRHTFTITTEDGTKYLFKNWAMTTIASDNASSYVSTWYLTKIITVNNREIDFGYESFGIGKSYPIRTFVQNYLPPGDLQNIGGPKIEIDSPYLTHIWFTDGRVDFNYSAENARADIPFAHYLESVVVSNSEGRPIKRHDFNYSYFGNANAGMGNLVSGDYIAEITYVGADNPHHNLRLKLDAVVEDGTKVHSFDYHVVNSLQIPNKTSMGQDYWGFYNGMLNTGTFIPDVPTEVPLFVVPNPATRHPVAAKAKLFSLKRIVYPTGGYTEFDYESNTYEPTPFADGTSVDYNFFIGTGLPFDIMATPLNTVPKVESSLSSGQDFIVEQVISPATATGVSVSFDLAIYGSTVAPGNRMNTDSSNPFNYQQDMFLRIIRNSDGVIVGQQQFNSAQASLDFQQTGQAFYSVAIDYPDLNAIGGYTLQAYFNDHGGMYFGQAKITASWEEREETGTAENPLDYSVGGGLRVRTISDFDSNGRIALKRNFDYHFKETLYDGTIVEKSHGKIKVLPDFQVNVPFTQDVLSPTPASIAIFASSSSQTPLSKHMGNYVGYGEVTVAYENTDLDDNGKVVSRFHNFMDIVSRGDNIGLSYLDSYFRLDPIRIPHNGLRYQQQFFKRGTDDGYALVSERMDEYRINGIDASLFNAVDFFRTSDFIMAGKIDAMPFLEPLAIQSENGASTQCRNIIFQFHPYYATRLELGTSTRVQYDGNGADPVVSTERVFYDNPIHYLPTRSETVDSEGNTVITQTWYPDDIEQGMPMEGGTLANYTGIDSLKRNGQRPRIGQPIQSLTINNGKKSLERTNFLYWGNGIVQPGGQQTLKGDLSVGNTAQDRIEVYGYDAFGNPLEFAAGNGPITSYIWGHNKKYLIAKLENASYQDIATALNTSVTVLKAFTEVDLPTIESLRTGLPQAMVTTYTYDPLVGVTSITDPKGYTTFFSYDGLNRLKEVRDADGNLVNDYQYHYKGQTN